MKQRNYIIISFSALGLSDVKISGRGTFSPSCNGKKNLITFFSNHVFNILVKVNLSAVLVILCKPPCKK